nr:glycosyltransferase family A protein [uncultured Mitsuokella sp.]
MIKVSVIIPVYNVDRYLHRCLESIQQQTYSNIEVLIVDDGSTDESLQICNSYKNDKRFHIFHQNNMGQSAARNFALDHVTGDYLIFVDADDYVECDLIQKCIENIDNDVNIDAVLFDHIEMEKDGNKPFIHEFKKKGIDIDWSDIKQVYHFILMDKISNLVWNKMYRKELWDNIRFPIGICYEDLFIHPMLFAKIKRIKYLPRYLYTHNRINPNSTTSRINDYNSWNRYCKFCAYREHERMSNLAKDDEAAYWSRSQAIHEAIKSFYINCRSSKKLNESELKDIKDYLQQIDIKHGKYNLNVKYKILKWSVVYHPIICEFYGRIRYYHEMIKNR